MTRLECSSCFTGVLVRLSPGGQDDGDVRDLDAETVEDLVQDGLAHLGREGHGGLNVNSP